MSRLKRRIINRRLGRFILYSGLSLVFCLTIVYPSTVALALQANPDTAPQPTTTSGISATPTLTPEAEVDGEVGANAGLVCGAVILVIIIIAGLMRSARWIPFRSGDGKGKSE